VPPHAESLLGGCLAAQKKYTEAEPLLLGGYRGLTEAPAAPSRHVEQARQRLIKFYEASGRPEEAAKWKAKPGQPGDAMDKPAAR
jgi:hypothetical protein